MRNRLVLAAVLLMFAAGGAAGWMAGAQEKPNPRQQPGALITMYAPEQHDLYDGHYLRTRSSRRAR